MYKHFFKRFIDFTLTLVGLICISPFLLVVMGLLAWVQKGKVFFRQDRPGKDGKIFKVLKFKTMTDECDADGNLLPNEQRLTTIGKFIRSFSIDEFPQLINVLKGDMSLIGPRPLLPKYLQLYSKEQARRHEVRPGMTGWAQVNGRNAISWEEKFRFDVFYVDHVSFLMDVKILWMTFMKVVARQDINAQANITMKPFEGNPKITLYGASGHAKVILDIMEAQGNPPHFIVDDYNTNNDLYGYPIKKDSKVYDHIIISIGDPKTRKNIVEQISVKKYLTAVHPSCVFSPRSTIDEGTVLMQGTIIQSSSTIGKHCIVNTGATVGHDCKLENFVHIAPNASLCGNVEVGEGTWIGAGSVVKQGVKIGKWSMIGAGSVVVDDIPDYVVAVGNKCKVIKQIEQL